MKRSLLGLSVSCCIVCSSATLVGSDVACASEMRTPISLGASTTVNADITSPRISLDDDPLAAFIVDIIPGGATFRVRYDGELSMQWDSTQVVVGQPFPVTVEFANEVSSGNAGVDLAYTIMPSFWIDYDAVFDEWPYDPPLETAREERFPIVDRTLRSVSRRVVGFTDIDGYSPFLLDEVHSLALQAADTVEVGFDLEIYPCVHLTVAGRVISNLGFAYGSDSVCVRYANAEDDTTCWKATSGFACRTTPGTWQFTDEVDCTATSEHVAPICPMYARGYVDMDVSSEVIIDTFEIAYTCSSPWLIKSIAPGPVTLAWVDHRTDFTSDRNHVMFGIPVVPQTPPAVVVTDAEGDPVTTLYANEQYTIQWDGIDSDLALCCAEGDSVRLQLRDLVNLGEDPSGLCGELISAQEADASPREYEWTVPDLSCFDGQLFRLFLEYYCPPGDSDHVLQRAWSEDLTIQGGAR